MSVEYGYLLVVDDDSSSYKTLRDALEHYNYTVIGASTGEQALTMLRRQSYDMVLLACDLPDIDSHEVLKTIKADAALRMIPVLMIARDDDLERLEECLRLGADDYINPWGSMVILRARIASCMEKSRLCNPELVSREKETLLIKIERDLQIGQDIQMDFLPKALPGWHGWDLAHVYRPAREVGGDLYDVFMMTQDGLVGLIIGDVCDKGVGAALFMALFRSLFRAGAQQKYPLSIALPISSYRDPTAIESLSTTVLQTTFELVNDYVIDNHHEKGYFATLFFGVLDPPTGRLLYVNGGHVPVFIIGSNGLKAHLTSTGPAVGLMSNTTFGVQKTQIDPGDILFTYTDGVTDARNPDRQFFGEKRLLQLVEQSAPSAKDMVDRVDSTIRNHIASAEQYDDITMLVVRRATA